MPFLVPNQQHQSAEGQKNQNDQKSKGLFFLLLEHCVFGLAASTTDNNIYGSECDI